MTHGFNHIVSADSKDEWLTPPEIIRALGAFTLDPCAPIAPPWATAAVHYNITHDGLKQPWFGRVWCNPPYGNQTFEWMRKCATHGDAIALIFARTETKGFHAEIWDKCSAVFFFKGRLSFWNQPFINWPGKDEKERIKMHDLAWQYFAKEPTMLTDEERLQWFEGATANAPSCLIAYGENNVQAIAQSGLQGMLVRPQRLPSYASGALSASCASQPGLWQQSGAR